MPGSPGAFYRHVFDRPAAGANAGAVLVQLDFGDGDYAERLDEFKLLATSAGAVPLALVGGKRSSPDAALYAGKGKVGEIAEAASQFNADIVLFNHELSPAQQRNLERQLQRRVIDRTSLILDIFALRARSHEGKLQVELAQLEHLATRLVRGWTHLERQKGGIGLRGPGETQLESDRRLISQRIRSLTERLGRVARQRRTAGKMRRKTEIPTVSLVGYTNAGKSTLFNRLTSAGVLVADQLFATLDPTLRRVRLPDGTTIVLADTVGFIRDLPHELVAAFRSTLEETRDSQLILHVIDSSDPAHQERIQDVIKVLEEIGAGQTPRIQVYNKTDILGAQSRVDRDATGLPVRVWLSSQTGDGVSSLLEENAEV